MSPSQDVCRDRLGLGRGGGQPGRHATCLSRAGGSGTGESGGVTTWQLQHVPASVQHGVGEVRGQGQLSTAVGAKERDGNRGDLRALVGWAWGSFSFVALGVSADPRSL